MALKFRPFRWAAALVLTTATAGCIATDGPDPSLTVNRANWVQTSIVQDMSIGVLGEDELIGIVADDGGGYVTRFTITGKRGTSSQRIVMDTVLGTSIVRDPPAGGEVNSGGNSPQVVLCFQFTIGWTDTMVSPPVQEKCPESASNRPTLAAEEADKIQAAENLAVIVDTPQLTVPSGRAAAVTLLARQGAHALKLLAGEGIPQQPGAAALAYALHRLSFASGSGVVAVAMPALGGGCVYETFTRGDSRWGVNPAWSAPLDAPCTGAAALAMSGPLSYNPQAGG
jgi:hypothetical protein